MPLFASVQILATLEAIAGLVLLPALVGRIVGLLAAQEASVALADQRDALESAAEPAAGEDTAGPSPP